MEQRLTPKNVGQLLVSSNSNEWFTPRRYIEAARRVLGAIDLDPASCAEANATVQATTYYTKADSGLDHAWLGRIWLNPPYGGLAGDFAARLLGEYSAGNVTAAIALLNANSAGTAWFKPLWDYTVCITDHWINFDSPTRDSPSTSTHSSIFVYLGDEIDLFAAVFALFGAITRRHGTAPRQCMWCGEWWVPKRSDAKTCSGRCRQALSVSNRLTGSVG